MMARSELIGLVGGMSWHSTAHYYRLLNQRSEAMRGVRSTAESLVVTLNFEPLFQMALNDEWQAIADRLAGAVARLTAGGASLVAFTAVTAHRVFDQIAGSSCLPCIHVLDPAGRLLQQRGIKRVGVLATRFAASQNFIDMRLGAAGVQDVLRPDSAGQARIDSIIEEQLAHGLVTPMARQAIDGIADDLRRRGAEVLLLACTELPLLYPDGDKPDDVVDSVGLHVDALLTHAKGTP